MLTLEHIGMWKFSVDLSKPEPGPLDKAQR